MKINMTEVDNFRPFSIEIADRQDYSDLRSMILRARDLGQYIGHIKEDPIAKKAQALLSDLEKTQR